MPWTQPGLLPGPHEAPRGCGEAPTGRAAGGSPAEGGPPLEGACLQKRMHPGESFAGVQYILALVSSKCCSSERQSSPSQGTSISSAQHREMILWLGEMSRLFHFSPDTSALGVCILNRLLSTVKVEGPRAGWNGVSGAFKLSPPAQTRDPDPESLGVFQAQPKYLRCITFTSLVLAAKINEEDEVRID